MKSRIVELLNQAKESDKASEAYKAAADKWIASKDDADASKEAAAELKPLIAEAAAAGCEINKELKTLDHYPLPRKAQPVDHRW